MNALVRGTTFALSRLFGALGVSKHGRATHTWGTASRGHLLINESPDFPRHAFFQAGKRFPVQIRHATLSGEDDAVKDLRSGSIKFSHQSTDSPLDLIMNTGELGVFWNLKSFIAFTWASGRGEKGIQKYCEKYPLGYRGAQDSVRRAPDSFLQLRYHSKLPFYFHTEDGQKLLVKFRLGPFDDLPDSGLVTGQDHHDMWKQKRLEDETRPLDYLRQEYIARIQQQPLKYRLSMQLHTLVKGESKEIYNSAKAWSEDNHPWIEVGVATMTESLSFEEAELLTYRVNHMPPSISLIPATSLTDYNSLAYARSKVYKYVQGLRLKNYKRKNQIGPTPTPQSSDTSTPVVPKQTKTSSRG
ncbi:MAG: hypothetical protein COB04_05225 [Gammaproteobacteria bacterium]|nr:MAG: hypothetical protein COB04_05225 [Gammaproteobacteria bacterium]